jgi:dolichyl-phosphate-mannose-protein mannosyltransferase
MAKEPPNVQKEAGTPAGADPWERRAVPAALALLALLVLQGLIFIGESSQTSDEAAHLAAGYSYLETADFRLNPEHPPLIKEWAALPLLLLDVQFPWGPLWDQAEEWNIGRIFVHENRLPNDTILLVGRIQVMILSLILGWFLFHWGRTLFGARGALLALALYVLDPNVVAHSCLVTTDLGVTLFMFLAVYALWTWSERPTPAWVLCCGLMVGGAFASKFTSFWLLPILLLLFAVLFALRTPSAPWPRAAGASGPEGPAWRRILALLLLAVCVAVVAFVVVAVTYAGVGMGAYLVGLERGLRHSGMGHKAYMMGQYSESGWWYYFLYAYAIKTPIGTLLIVAASITALLLGRRIRLKDELFLGIPIVVLVLVTCLWKVNIGLRHFLPVYPFLYLAAGRLLPRPDGALIARRPGVGWAIVSGVLACVAWNAVEAATIAPYHLAYFNEILGGPRRGHLYLLDSNLDWGQSSKALRRYMESENLPILYCAYSGNGDPWYYGVRYQYAPGSGNLDNAKERPVRVPEGLPREVLAVSAMVLHSVHFTDTEVWAPLRRQTPIAMPGYSFFVFDITRNADAHAYIAALYLSFGMDDLADYEARRTLRLDPKSSVAQAVLDKLKEKATAPPGAPGG